MAILFHNDYLTCPRCGSKLVVREEVAMYEKDPKDPSVYIPTPVNVRLRCAACDETVLSVKDNDLTKILSKR